MPCFASSDLCLVYFFWKSIWLPFHVLKNCWTSGRQCRLWSDASFCITWSGLTRFAQALRQIQYFILIDIFKTLANNFLWFLFQKHYGKYSTSITLSSEWRQTEVPQQVGADWGGKISHRYSCVSIKPTCYSLPDLLELKLSEEHLYI